MGLLPTFRGCRHNQADVVRRPKSILASASHGQVSLTSVKTSWCLINRRARSFRAWKRSTGDGDRVSDGDAAVVAGVEQHLACQIRQRGEQ